MLDFSYTPTTIAGAVGFAASLVIAYFTGKNVGHRECDTTIREKDARIDRLQDEHRRLEKSEERLRADLAAATKPQVITISDKAEEVESLRRQVEETTHAQALTVKDRDDARHKSEQLQATLDGAVQELQALRVGVTAPGRVTLLSKYIDAKVAEIVDVHVRAQAAEGRPIQRIEIALNGTVAGTQTFKPHLPAMAGAAVIKFRIYTGQTRPGGGLAFPGGNYTLSAAMFDDKGTIIDRDLSGTVRLVLPTVPPPSILPPTPPPSNFSENQVRLRHELLQDLASARCAPSAPPAEISKWITRMHEISQQFKDDPIALGLINEEIHRQKDALQRPDDAV